MTTKQSPPRREGAEIRTPQKQKQQQNPVYFGFQAGRVRRRRNFSRLGGSTRATKGPTFFFGEKHGKGQVDGLFGAIEGWLANYLKKPGSRIASIGEMESVLRAEANGAMSLDPAVQFVVVRWEPEQKPATTWALPSSEFQISRTYCLELLPGNPRVHVRNTAPLDCTFTEVAGAGGSRSFPKVEQEIIQDRSWRRGYFASKRWDRKPPERGEKHAVLARFEEHKRRKMPLPNLKDEWERSARQQASKLLRRRQKWKQVRDKARGQEISAPNSSESSTSSSSGSSSST